MEYIPQYYINKHYRASNDHKLKNALYALICPRLESNESRGFNGHARTQAIMDMVIKEMDEWLNLQADHDTK